MPVELKYPDQWDEFKEKAKKAIECRLVRKEKKGTVKIKARTKRYLYTVKAPLDKADDLVKELREQGCENLVEIK
ncbi:MAG: 5'-nucleotidase [Desulfurococcales archaeon]|nr:5'-nucleotidase [Desulfurococcales archaeon]